MVRARAIYALVQTAYVQAPVVQIAPEISGNVTELIVRDNEEVKLGSPLFRLTIVHINTD